MPVTTLNPAPVTAPAADPSIPHTLAEFAPAKADLRGPKCLVPVGFWHPTPNHSTYLRENLEQESADYERMNQPGARANRTPPPSAESVERCRQRIEVGESLPWPRANTNQLSEEDTATLLRYLMRESHHWEAFRGYSACRLCDKWDNGDSTIDDGVYAWPSGLAHYVAAHGVGVPEEFVAHALRGGTPPVVEVRAGYIAVRSGDAVSDIVGRLPEHALQDSPATCADRINSAFGSIGGPLWDYFAVPVVVTVVNGRIARAEVSGAKTLVVPASTLHKL